MSTNCSLKNNYRKFLHMTAWLFILKLFSHIWPTWLLTSGLKGHNNFCYWSSQTIILMTTIIINDIDMTSQLQTCWCFAFSIFRYPGFFFQGGGNSEYYRVSTRFLLFIIFLENFSSSNVKKFSGSQNNNTSLSDSLLSMLSNSALKMTSQLCRMLKNFSWTLSKW